MAVVHLSSHPRFSKRWQGHDRIFIHYSQVSIGLVLEYFGRLDHGSRWRITGITSHKDGRHVTIPRSLHYTIQLVRVHSNETHEISMAHLSYSATWRIPQ